jgi:Xaa-Pro aminopeptidase
MKRRDLLKTSLVTGSLLPLNLSANTKEKLDPLALEAHRYGAEILRGGPLINLERAYKVMNEEDLDGLIVTDPMNVFHFTGYYDHMYVRINTPQAFALLSRDEKQNINIVLNQFIYYYSVADSKFEWPSEIYLFTGWDNKIDEKDSDINHMYTEPQPNPPFVFKDLEEKKVRASETKRINQLNKTLKNKSASADAKWALIKAVKNMGLDKGKIGIDHPVIAQILNSKGIKASTVDADHALRRIRIIKSRREIELMRLTAKLNSEAALTAVKMLRSGITHKEFRAIFFSECAKRGNMPLLLQIDTANSEIYDAELKNGAAFSIDAVSQAFHYTGDYGRTVFIGEPDRSMKKATEAIAIGWDAVREILRPGVRYSEIRSIGREAIKKAGYDFGVAVTPHSVGLSHTDEPGRDGAGAFWIKDDLILEENMVISVDMPVLNTGIGGSAHLEDLTLITKDGNEQINDIDDRIIVV